MNICGTCNKECEQENAAVCDGCKKYVCVDCSELSSTEIRCIALKKRRLLFLCNECEQGFKLLPLLLNKVEILEKKVSGLIEEKDKYKNTTEVQISQNEIPMAQFECMINEVEERKRRANNVIMLNVNESTKENRLQRNKDELETVLTIIKDITISDNNIKVQRLGKFNPDKNRPIKIVFMNADDAKEVLRNRNKIIRVRLFGDQTKQQRDYYKFVKTQLNQMIANGETNKTIKYINSIPTIITAQTNH